MKHDYQPVDLADPLVLSLWMALDPVVRATYLAIKAQEDLTREEAYLVSQTVRGIFPASLDQFRNAVEELRRLGLVARTDYRKDTWND